MRSKQTDLDVSVYQEVKDAAKTYSQEQAKPKQNQNPRVAGLTRGTRTQHHAQPRSQNHPSLAGDGDTHSSGKKKTQKPKQDLRKWRTRSRVGGRNRISDKRQVSKEADHG